MTVRSAASPRRTASLVALVALALLTLAAALLPGAGTGQGAAGPVSPQPALGAADSDVVLMGATDDETWGYRVLPLSVDSASVDGNPVPFGDQPASGPPEPQLAFLRQRSSGGWQIAQTPADEDGRTFRRMFPNHLSARLTPGGGGVLVGRDIKRPVTRQTVVLHRNPGGRFAVLGDPPPTALLPGERLAGDEGSGRVAAAAFDAAGKTNLLFAALGPPAESAVVRFDGSGWSREPVEVPPGSSSDFKILAIGASGPEDAWLLARTDPSLGRGVVLFERVNADSSPRWVERGLGANVFSRRETPGQGVSGVAPLSGSAQPLTPTSDGVWIDGSLTESGTDRDFTLFFDQGAGEVTGSWCDSPLCANRLGAEFSRQTGYRSFAWSGSGFGSRIVTNPLDDRDSESTNRGTYLRFENAAVRRMPGGGGNFRASGAFRSVTSGWLQGPVQVTGEPRPDRLSSWPIALRSPLSDIDGDPDGAAADLGSRALAVGPDGAVARYIPGRGWTREFLLTSSGSVSKPTLRGVAWPARDRAHAVGDFGAMWQWNADNELWELDPGTPVGFESHLMDVDFQPGDPERGFAVGRNGTLLRYGKSWDQEQLPGPYGSADLTQVAFAGSQALVAAGRGVLVNDGGGWREDAGVRQLLDGVRAGDPQIVAVAGLPDGGAIAAGRDVVLERDSGSAPWRFSDQPIVGSTAIAAGAFRDGGRVRALLSVVPRLPYPPPDELPPPDPNVPPPILQPFPLPGDGYVLRESGDGWIDQERTAFSGSGNDRPIKSDPVLAFLLDGSGQGWAVGGWSGEADSAGRGSSARNSSGRETRARVRTGAILRYGFNPAGPPARTRSPVPVGSGPIRFAVAGHAQCELPCVDLSAQGIAPDRTLSALLGAVSELRGAEAGPRALLYTGGRSGQPLVRREADRYAELLGGSGGVPVFPALSKNDSADGATHFKSAFRFFNGPFGAGPAPAGVDSSGVPGAPGDPGQARTHYAFDSTGSGGRVRVIVIDNSAGSLAASRAHQNPNEDQLSWLQGALADAKAKGIPAIVVGSRDLNSRFTPQLNTASDADQVARVLVDGGASAYLFERPEENRAYRIPAGGATTIPAFGTGTLGYRSPLSASNANQPDALFGDSGYLMLELDASRRDPATNRAPVSARMIPVVEDLSLEATDGTLIRRSRVALFRGLGRRPRAGDRWGRIAGADGNPNPPGADPYTNFPPDQCLVSGCATRLAPEYEFRSSDDDIGDFVRQDPNSSNLRKPFLDANDKVVTDNRSGLFCAFNAGTTTVTIRSGGFAYAEKVTVLAGSVRRPCGTRPLRPDRFRRAASASPSSPPPPGPGGSGPPVAPVPPPGIAAAPPILPAAPRRPGPPGRPRDEIPPVPPRAPLIGPIPAIAPPPPPASARPLPPGGAPGRVYQVERDEEEEVAIEESQAFARYEPDGGGSIPPALIVALILLGAFSGAVIRRAGRGREHRQRRALPAPSYQSANRTRRRFP